MKTAEAVQKLIADQKAAGVDPSLIVWNAALACVGWAYVFGARGENCTPANRRKYYASKGADHPTIRSACKNFDGDGNCSGCKWFPEGKRTCFFDCRGFTYRLILDVYGWKLNGSGCSSQWNDKANWKAKGEVSEGIPQNVIVCLFYYKKDSKGNRTKTLSHTGFYYNGQTVECSNGVQKSNTLNKKWEVWGVPACVDSKVVIPDKPQKPAESGSTKLPILRNGNKGTYVKKAQQLLLERGYSLGICGVDGDFGPATEKAVRQFQQDWGLTPVDGIIGQNTWEKLMSTPVKEKTYTVTIRGLSKAKADALKKEYAGAIIKEE